MPVKVLLPSTFTISLISPGYYHNLVIGTEGTDTSQKLYFWGRGNYKSENGSMSFYIPVPIIPGTTERFSTLCCTEDTCLLATSNQVYIHYSGDTFITRLSFYKPLAPNDYIRHIECGANHYLLLTQAGQVFGFGDNQLFKLGYNSIHSVIPDIVPSNMFMEKVQNGEVIDILCNLDNSYIVVRRYQSLEIAVILAITFGSITLWVSSCALFVLFLIAYFCGRKNEQNKSRKRDMELQLQLLTTADDDSFVDLNVDKSLFEIQFSALSELTGMHYSYCTNTRIEIGAGSSGAIVYVSFRNAVFIIKY